VAINYSKIIPFWGTNTERGVASEKGSSVKKKTNAAEKKKPMVGIHQQRENLGWLWLRIKGRK